MTAPAPLADPSLACRSATDLARLLRQREISAEALLCLYLDRADRFNPALNAICVRDDAAALARARAADAALARGECWGPLHGLPMTVKEAFDVTGWPSTWGYPELRDNIAPANAVAVQRLLQAGAVIYGKTNVPVALADWQSFNPVYGTSHNPWDLSRSPGGSSGGSAAVLAAGLAALELGSDIGASIRNPAHYCGVYGHKPTWGVVPMAGHAPPGVACIDTLDIAVAGPMARSAHDLTLALDVLTAPLHLFGRHGAVPVQWQDRSTAPRQMRVAVMSNEVSAEVDRSVSQAIEQLARFLRDAGLAVHDVDCPVDPLASHAAYSGLLRSGQTALLDDAHYQAVVDEAARYAPDDVSYGARHWRNNALSHRAWEQHNQTRLRLQQQWADFFERYDVLICPIAATPAVKHNHVPPRWEQMLNVNGQHQPQTTQLFWAGLPGMVGLPATAVPLGLSDEGLPVGAQIIGPLLGDPMTLRLAAWLEAHYRAFVPPPGYE